MASLVMAGGEISKVGTGVIRPPPASDAADDEDDDSVSRTGPLRPTPAAQGSRRNRPKQLTVTNTTALLSPGPMSHKAGQVGHYTYRLCDRPLFVTDKRPL